MTREQAEEMVYVYWTIGTIESEAKRMGLKIKYTKSGKISNRAELEEKIINALASNTETK